MTAIRDDIRGRAAPDIRGGGIHPALRGPATAQHYYSKVTEVGKNARLAARKSEADMTYWGDNELQVGDDEEDLELLPLTVRTRQLCRLDSAHAAARGARFCDVP
jgi:hypothetical protein